MVVENCHGTLDDECGANETCRQVPHAADEGFQGVCDCLTGFYRDASRTCVLNSVPTASPSTSVPII
ncbi:unnamed protein product, partial [Nesidiocoris tenuis]